MLLAYCTYRNCLDDVAETHPGKSFILPVIYFIWELLRIPIYSSIVLYCINTTQNTQDMKMTRSMNCMFTLSQTYNFTSKSSLPKYLRWYVSDTARPRRGWDRRNGWHRQSQRRPSIHETVAGHWTKVSRHYDITIRIHDNKGIIIGQLQLV